MKKYGLVGFPLSHSFSKKYFTEKFDRLRLTDCRYDLYEMPVLAELTRLLKDPQLQGLNITIPHKKSVKEFVTGLDPVAQATGVINTLKLRRTSNDLSITGYNTDAHGFRTALLPLLKPWHKLALVFGTGATASTVSYVLKELGIDSLCISRHPKKDAPGYGQLEPWMSKAHLLVNTTPLGMYPNTNESPDIPYPGLTPQHLLFDVVYNPADSLFLQRGREVGAATENGLKMLHAQADEAWRIWNEEQ